MAIVERLYAMKNVAIFAVGIVATYLSLRSAVFTSRCELTLRSFGNQCDIIWL